MLKMCLNGPNIFFPFTFNYLSEAVDLLDHLWQVANHSNASVTHEDRRCPVLHVGQYSTLSVPLQQVFGHRYVHSPATDIKKSIFILFFSLDTPNLVCTCVMIETCTYNNFGSLLEYLVGFFFF